jgi:hypothetical protein
VAVPNGRLISIPYSLEVNDHYGFFVYNMSPREHADTLVRQFDRLASEGEQSGTVMCKRGKFPGVLGVRHPDEGWQAGYGRRTRHG